MTERLYYNDPYLREFDADVVDADDARGEDRGRPRSDGVLSDVGRPAVRRRHAVGRHGPRRRRHRRRPAAARRRSRCRTATRCTGAIDWTRRFDHMQQHTGQHVLSAAFDRLLSARTESFHLGAEYSTIDLARELIGGGRGARRSRGQPHRLGRSAGRDPFRGGRRGRDAGAAQGVEARRHAAADRRRRTSISPPAAARTWREPARSASSRSPATERFRGGLRVTFLCGGRALTGFRACATPSPAACARCRCCPRNCPPRSSACRRRAKELRRQVKDLQGRLAAHEADALADAAVDAGGRQAGRRGAARLGRRGAEDDRGAHRRASRHVAVLVGDPPTCRLSSRARRTPPSTRERS